MGGSEEVGEAKSRYRFRWAESEGDYAALRRLNHEIFAGELRQHAETAEGVLVDRYEAKSRFLLAWREDELAGMVSVHGEPPYSIEQKLADASLLDRYQGRKLEVRLLAIRPGERNRMALAGLLGHVLQTAREEGFAWLLISGLRERMGFYERLGFAAIGPAVQSGEACYAPMVMEVAKAPEKIEREFAKWRMGR